MGKAEIVVVGSYAAGLTMRTPRFPVPGETVIGGDYKSLHGGKGSNQAVGCARLGAVVHFIACIGDDNRGHDALALYRREGVDASGVRTLSDSPTGTGFIMVNDAGENEIVIDFGANNRLSADQIETNRIFFENSKVLLVQMEIPTDPIIAAVNLAKETGVFSILNPAPYHPLPDKTLTGVSLITPNRTEAALILGMIPDIDASPEELGKALRQKGILSSIITLGSRGMQITTDSISEKIDAFNVEAVDTTGAGDAFTAALGIAIAEGASLKEAALFAAAAAALSATKYGVIESLPPRAEVDEFLEKEGLGLLWV
jgi:ribokinase